MNPPTHDVRLRRRALLGGLSAAAALAACGSDPAGAGADDQASLAPLLPPADLVGRLADVKAGKVAVFHIGPRTLWRQGHVPGTVWVGEAGKAEGLAALEAAVKALPPETEVVAYCGCCPVVHCPNVKPARRALAARPNARVLDLPTTFDKDWVQKGYEVERS